MGFFVFFEGNKKRGLALEGTGGIEAIETVEKIETIDIIDMII